MGIQYDTVYQRLHSSSVTFSKYSFDFDLLNPPFWCTNIRGNQDWLQVDMPSPFLFCGFAVSYSYSFPSFFLMHFSLYVDGAYYSVSLRKHWLPICEGNPNIYSYNLKSKGTRNDLKVSRRVWLLKTKTRQKTTANETSSEARTAQIKLFGDTEVKKISTTEHYLLSLESFLGIMRCPPLCVPSNFLNFLFCWACYKSSKQAFKSQISLFWIDWYTEK